MRAEEENIVYVGNALWNTEGVKNELGFLVSKLTH